jgi:hypothetical protein
MSRNGGDYNYGITVMLDRDYDPVGMRHWTSADFEYCAFCGAFGCSTSRHGPEGIMIEYDLRNLGIESTFEIVDEVNPNEQFWPLIGGATKILKDWMRVRRIEK